MSRPQSRLLPIPHLFIGVSLSIFLFLVVLMAAPAVGEVVDGTCAGNVTMEGERVVDAQQRPQSMPVASPDRGTGGPTDC